MDCGVEFGRPWTASENAGHPLFLTGQRETRSREKIVSLDILGLKLRKKSRPFKNDSFRTIKPIRLAASGRKVWNIFAVQTEPLDTKRLTSKSIDFDGCRRRSSVASAECSDWLAPSSFPSSDNCGDIGASRPAEKSHESPQKRTGLVGSTLTSHRMLRSNILDLRSLRGSLDIKRQEGVVERGSQRAAFTWRTAPEAVSHSNRSALRPSTLPYVLIEFDRPTLTMQASLVNGDVRAPLWQHDLAAVQTCLNGAPPRSPASVPAPPRAARAACAHHLSLLRMLPAGRCAAFLDRIALKTRAAALQSPHPPSPPRGAFAAKLAAHEPAGCIARPASLRSIEAPDWRPPPRITLQGPVTQASAAFAAAPPRTRGEVDQQRRGGLRRGWRVAGHGGARRLGSRRRARHSSAPFSQPTIPQSILPECAAAVQADSDTASKLPATETPAIMKGLEELGVGRPSATCKPLAPDLQIRRTAAARPSEPPPRSGRGAPAPRRPLFLTELLGCAKPPVAPAAFDTEACGYAGRVSGGFQEACALDAGVLQRLRAALDPRGRSTAGVGGDAGGPGGLSPTPPASPRPLRATLPSTLWNFPLCIPRRAVAGLAPSVPSPGTTAGTGGLVAGGNTGKEVLPPPADGHYPAAGPAAVRRRPEAQETPRRGPHPVQLQLPEVLDSLRGGGVGGAHFYATPRTVAATPRGRATAPALAPVPGSAGKPVLPVLPLSARGLEGGGDGSGGTRRLRAPQLELPLVTVRETALDPGAATSRTRGEWEGLRQAFIRRGWRARHLVAAESVQGSEVPGEYATVSSGGIGSGTGRLGGNRLRRGSEAGMTGGCISVCLDGDSATIGKLAVLGGRVGRPSGILLASGTGSIG